MEGLSLADEQLLGEVAALEPLPEETFERLEMLRHIASAPGVLMDHCPECGQALEGLDLEHHAQLHWPDYQLKAGISPEAKQRRDALLRAHRASKPKSQGKQPEGGD